MSHLSRFVAQPALPGADVDLLAKHVALDILGPRDLCVILSLDPTELDRLKANPSFLAAVVRERRRLLTIDGQRELLEWKQAQTEGQYWDRLMDIGLKLDASATAIIDGMKVVRRPAERGQPAGGGGGSQFVVQINMPGTTTTVVSAPIIEGTAG